jgi:hypothetical protein
MEEYCAEELALHYEAVLRHRARTTKHWARVLRIAPNADKKIWRQFTRELDDTWKRIELAAGRSTVDVEKFFGGMSRARGK